MDDLQFQYLGIFVLKCAEIWNSYFDKHNVDFILTPTQYSKTLKLDEMVESRGPILVLRNNTYKTELVGNAMNSNFPLLFATKIMAISKVQVPLGTDVEGRPIGMTIWSR